MKSSQPNSQDSLSRTLSRPSKQVRFCSSEKFKVDLKKIKTHHRESRFIKTQQLPPTLEEQHQDIKQSFYFRVKVISKIAVFIQKLKTLVALSNPNFKNNEMDYIETQVSTDDQNRLLFSSDNKLIILIQALVLVASILSIWNASFLLLFPQNSLLPFQLRICMLVLFAFEILINLFVIPKNNLKQEHQNNHKQVILQYLKNDFFYDAVSFLSLIILELINYEHILSYAFKFLAILKVGTVLRVVGKFQQMYVTSPESESKVSIIKLIMKILTFVHILSLALNLLNQVQISKGIENTWLRRYGMGDSTPLEMYLCGWYWGATILTTVGFGDIAPANIYEAFTISFIQIICCAIFGYSINYIGGLIGMIGQSTEIFEKQMRRVNQYLSNLDVSKNLKDQIRQHFYNKEKIKKIHDPVAQSIVMDNIPVPMKSQVLETNNKNVLQKTCFFQRYDDKILNLLAMKLKRIIYSPDEAIFNKGDSKSKLWILQKGNISEFYNNQPNNSEKIIAQYDTSTVQPGYLNFITGQPFTTYSRSLGFSWTYELSRQDMLNILIKFKTQYFKFCQLKDKLIQKGKKFVSRCCACLKLNHNALQCPKIHFQAKISLYKISNKSRLYNNSRHFYPRTNEKYKSLNLFSSMLEQQNLSSNNIYISNQRRLSTEEMVPVLSSNRQSRRISTILPEFCYRLPPLAPTHLHPQRYQKQHFKSQSEVLKTQENVPQEYQYKFWFDRGQFCDAQSYFPESYVKEITTEYNSRVKKSRQKDNSLLFE